MDGNNFVHLDDFSFFNDTYMYVDTAEHLADQIFIQHKLRIRFKEHYMKDGEKYRYIICKAPKKRKEDFCACMNDLERKMLLFGHTDYPKFCNQGVLEAVKIRQDEGKGDV